jgi:hypothetical protein
MMLKEFAIESLNRGEWVALAAFDDGVNGLTADQAIAFIGVLRSVYRGRTFRIKRRTIPCFPAQLCRLREPRTLRLVASAV